MSDRLKYSRLTQGRSKRRVFHITRDFIQVYCKSTFRNRHWRVIVSDREKDTKNKYNSDCKYNRLKHHQGQWFYRRKRIENHWEDRVEKLQGELNWTEFF